MALAQAKAGHQVQVFCFNHQVGQPTEIFMDGGVKIFRFRVNYNFARLAYVAELTKAIVDSNADIFHLQVPNPSMILSYAIAQFTNRLPRIPVVVTYQSDHVNQPLRGLFFSPIENYFYSSVDRILATSESYRNSSPLLRRFKDRVTVVPLGIPTEKIGNPTPMQIQQSEEIRKHYGSPLWITCSRLVPYKGIQFAIQAMKEAPGQLLILGDGPERDRLRRLCERHGISDRVHFLGFQADLLPYFMAATALWLPSINRAEAFGIIQIEAMAAGLPVINCSIEGSGVAEVSVNGESGFTVPVGSATAIAAAAIKIHENPNMRAAFSANALSRVTKNYELSTCVDQIFDVYSALTSSAQVVKIGASHNRHRAPTFKTAEMTTKIVAEHPVAPRRIQR